MYKITIKHSNKRNLRVVTVYKKENVLLFNYWNAVERVLCSTKSVDDFTDHYISKYNIATESTNHTIFEARQSA